MAGFRKALDRLREAEFPARMSIADQLRLLEDGPQPSSRRRYDNLAADLPRGEERRNASGVHYVVRRSWDSGYYHGRVRLDRASMDDFAALLMRAGCDHDATDRERIVFLDTETTGVHGGAGICPFLVGAGFFRDDAFHVVQYFIRDFDEEASMLLALGELLEGFALIVTYNGQAFDLPLIENRSVLARMEPPFERLAHLDLLFMARRLWRAGHGSCRLTALERSILGFDRGIDIHGSLIPRAYFDYLRAADATSLGSVFRHHAFDIVSLAALMVAAADRITTAPAALDDPLDLYSLGRVFDTPSDRARSIRCYEMALAGGIPDRSRVRTMERLSVLHRRGGDPARSMALCGELMAMEEFNLTGYEGAAIHHERYGGDPAAAAAVIDAALTRLAGVPETDRRRMRLQARRARLARKLGMGLFPAANA